MPNPLPPNYPVCLAWTPLWIETLRRYPRAYTLSDYDSKCEAVEAMASAELSQQIEEWASHITTQLLNWGVYEEEREPITPVMKRGVSNSLTWLTALISEYNIRTGANHA